MATGPFTLDMFGDAMKVLSEARRSGFGDTLLVSEEWKTRLTSEMAKSGNKHAHVA